MIHGTPDQKRLSIGSVDALAYAHPHEAIRYGLYKFCIENVQSSDYFFKSQCMAILASLASSFDLDTKQTLFKTGLVQHVFDRINAKPLDVEDRANSARFLCKLLRDIRELIFASSFATSALSNSLDALVNTVR